MSNPMIAYCGPASIPGDFWMRWNLDPFVLAALVGLSLYAARGRCASPRAAWCAVALMFVVFVSPLCALSSALFSARVLHHVLLVSAVAPLLAVAFPQRRANPVPLVVLVVVHALVLWTWHTPGAYAWGLASVPAYWLMQLSLLGSAWLMWRSILATPLQAGPALMALTLTVAQMGLLGAVIVFAQAPLYAVHFASTAAWGLDPYTDQQLAGLLMWVPAMLPYLGVLLWIAWSGLRTREPDL